MIIESLKLYSYKLPLHKKLQLKEISIIDREGFILELISNRGIKVYSEIAPLPSFSQETSSDVIREIKLFKDKFVQRDIPPDLLSQLAIYAPSVRFGLESAFLQLTALSKELTLVDLLNPNAKQKVSLNALLAGNHEMMMERAKQLYETGYRAFKIKIGRDDANREIETILKVREIVGESSLIRLDANRAFEIDEFISYYEKIKSANIDYIEEPFKSLEQIKKYFDSYHDKIPIALDESLQEIQPEMLNQLFAVKSIVLKPTLLGYTNSMMFAKKAFALGIQPVISSSFETSLGIYLLASMGAIIDSSIPIGLDTLSWFKDDIMHTPLTFTNGMIDLSKHTNYCFQLDFSKLSEVSLDNV